MLYPIQHSPGINFPCLNWSGGVCFHDESLINSLNCFSEYSFCQESSKKPKIPKNFKTQTPQCILILDLRLQNLSPFIEITARHAIPTLQIHNLVVPFCFHLIMDFPFSHSIYTITKHGKTGKCLVLSVFWWQRKSANLGKHCLNIIDLLCVVHEKNGNFKFLLIKGKVIDAIVSNT